MSTVETQDKNKDSLNFLPLDNLKTSDLSKNDLTLIVAIVLFGCLLLIGQFLISFLFYMLVAVAGLVLYFVRKTQAISSANYNAMVTFAEVNNFTFLSSATKDTLSSKPGTLFQHGHSKNLQKQIEGEFAGLRFSLFNYHYVVGSGKNQSHYSALVYEAVLPRTLPHMIIDSLVETGNGQTSTLPINFERSQKLELEGDFYKYFALYAPDTYGVTALTIIAPDAMETLLRHAALCDIEIIGDRLYFYWPGTPHNREQYEDVFSCVKEVLQEIGDKLTRDNIFTGTSQEAIHSSPGAAGARLKSNRAALYYSTAIVAAYTLTYLIPELYAMLPLILLILAATVHRSYMQSKRARLRNDLLKRYQP